MSMDEFFDFIALALDENDLEIRRRISFTIPIKLSEIIDRGLAYMPVGSATKVRITKTIVGPN